MIMMVLWPGGHATVNSKIFERSVSVVANLNDLEHHPSNQSSFQSSQAFQFQLEVLALP
jgi:hypothetical protein